MNENHTITVTAVPNDENDDIEFTIDHCPGGQCAVWWECKTCAEYIPTEDEIDEGEYARHGEDHQRIDGYWMTQSEQCALGSTDSGADGAREVADEAGLGTHEVSIDYSGDGHWDVFLVPAPTLPVGATVTGLDHTPCTTTEGVA